MKKGLLTLLASLLITLTTFAQAPEGFKYQAVIRDAGNTILTNQPVGVLLSIQQGAAGGTAVYTESFATTTNAYGLVNLEIGTGTTTDDFSAIDWANGPYFIETSIDVTGGTSYTQMGVSQLMSVPYALYAKAAANTFSGDYNDLTNQPAIPANTSDLNNDSGFITSPDDADADPTNELNTGVILNGTDLEVTDAGGTIITDLSFLIDDEDADTTNELNTGVVLNGNDLEITDAGGTIITDLTPLVDDGDWIINGSDLYNANPGNIGIGTATPVAKLDVLTGRVEFQGATDADGTPGTGVLEISNTLRLDGDEILTNNGLTLFIQHNNVGDVRMDDNTFMLDASADRIGMGTVLPQARLHVNNGAIMPAVGLNTTSGIYFPPNPFGGVSDEAYIQYYAQSGENGSLRIACSNDLDDDITFYQYGAERMVLYNGCVGIGTSTPGWRLHMAEDNAAKPTTNTWTVPSDRRLKTDVKPYTSSIDDLMKINTVWYTYTGEAGLPKDTGVGVIAQELKEVAPYMVETWNYTDDKGEKTEYLAVNNGAMTYMLINSVKEQQAMIEAQKAENDELKQMILKLNARMEQLEKK